MYGGGEGDEDIPPVVVESRLFGTDGEVSLSTWDDVRKKWVFDTAVGMVGKRRTLFKLLSLTRAKDMPLQSYARG
jgi:hypothetical protein